MSARESRLLGVELRMRRLRLLATERTVQVRTLGLKGTRHRVVTSTQESVIRTEAHLARVYHRLRPSLVIVRLQVAPDVATRDTVHLYRAPGGFVYTRCAVHGISSTPRGAVPVYDLTGTPCPMCAALEQGCNTNTCYTLGAHDPVSASLVRARRSGRCIYCGDPLTGGVTCGRVECIRQWLPMAKEHTEESYD